MSRSTNQAWQCWALFASLVVFSSLRVAAANVGDSEVREAEALEPIVVTGRAHRDAAGDQALETEVQAALHNDPYFDDGMVTVTVKDGVVTLEGSVTDLFDRQRAKLISKKIPGVRRVINALEFECVC
jgi:osmotically-inducible protein OsmY